MTDRQMRHMLSHVIARAQPLPERYYHICWWEQSVQCHPVHHTKEHHEVFFSAPGHMFLDELSAVQWRLLTTRIIDFCGRCGVTVDLHSGRRQESEEAQTQPRRVTESDAARLHDLLAEARTADPALYARAHRDSLRRLLETATVVPSRDVPPNVVTMNSLVRLQDDKDDMETDLYLVFPSEARGSDLLKPKISILTRTGLSLLGREVGDRIDNRLRILDLPYQPEAAGDFDL